jgi:hypothetical protein
VLLRCPATFGCGGFINTNIRGRVLSMNLIQNSDQIQILCSWTTDLNIASDRILSKQSDPENVFPVEELPLKQKLTRTRSKGSNSFPFIDFFFLSAF